jgi:hypothetical protein
MEVANTQFLNQFQTYFGKAFEIVTGRNAYSFGKEKHAEMMAADGIYLLLENQPIEHLKHKHGKALFIPARSADKFFSTNDPEKIKTSYNLPADKIRFEFSKQTHKLYQMTACIFKVVNFEDTRRPFRIDRKDYEYLLKNEGEFIFIFTVGNKPDYMVEVERLAAKSIVGFIGNTKKQVALHFELNAYTLKMLNDLGLRKLLTKEVIPLPPAPTKTVQTAQTALTDGSKVVEQYLGIGLPIRIVFPEGEHELVLECTITKQERREIKN